MALPPDPLEDSSPMPFGQYKGLRMDKVPARYLHWLWVNGKKEDVRCPVANYIRSNLTVLQKEYEDGIW